MRKATASAILIALAGCVTVNWPTLPTLQTYTQGGANFAIGAHKSALVEQLGLPTWTCAGQAQARYFQYFAGVTPRYRTTEWAWNRIDHVLVVYLEAGTVVQIGVIPAADLR